MKRAVALSVEGRRRRGRLRLRWEDCMKREWEWEGRMRARDGGVEMGGEDGNETALVMKKGKQKSMTCISLSLTLDYRDKEGHNPIPKIL